MESAADQARLQSLLSFWTEPHAGFADTRNGVRRLERSYGRVRAYGARLEAAVLTLRVERRWMQLLTVLDQLQSNYDGRSAALPDPAYLGAPAEGDEGVVEVVDLTADGDAILAANAFVLDEEEAAWTTAGGERLGVEEAAAACRGCVKMEE